MFMDSDDGLFKNAVEATYAKMVEPDADVMENRKSSDFDSWHIV